MQSSTELQRKVIAAVEVSVEKARDYFKKPLIVPEVRFDLRGKSAGQARFEVQRSWGGNKSHATIRFNRLLMQENPQAFIDEVAPHEAAHVIAHQLFGTRIKPHGQEWKMIMRTVLNRDPVVTHRFDIARASPKPWLYQCHCPEVKHELSTIRHNRIQRQQTSYMCRQCKAPLSYIGSLRAG